MCGRVPVFLIMFPSRYVPVSYYICSARLRSKIHPRSGKHIHEHTDKPAGPSDATLVLVKSIIIHHSESDSDSDQALFLVSSALRLLQPGPADKHIQGFWDRDRDRDRLIASSTYQHIDRPWFADRRFTLSESTSGPRLCIREHGLVVLRHRIGTVQYYPLDRHLSQGRGSRRTYLVFTDRYAANPEHKLMTNPSSTASQGSGRTLAREHSGSSALKRSVQAAFEGKRRARQTATEVISQAGREDDGAGDVM